MLLLDAAHPRGVPILRVIVNIVLHRRSLRSNDEDTIKAVKAAMEAL